MAVTLWYLATPYSKYQAGLYAAYRLACVEAARLIRAGIPVFSPIAHTHPIAAFSDMDPLDHNIWLPADEPMMDAASGLIMLKAKGWEESYGMQVERRHFEERNKPVVWMTPGCVPVEFLT